MQESLGRRIWRVISPLALFYAINLIVSIGVTFMAYPVVMKELGQTADAIPMQTMMNMFYDFIQKYAMQITMVVMVLVIICARRMVFRDNTMRSFKPDMKSIPMYVYPLALGVGICLCVGINFLINGFDLYTLFNFDTEEYEALYFSGKMVIELVTLCIISPVAEELIFRNLFYRRIRDYMGRLPSVLLTSLAFCIYHGDPIQGLYAFAAGAAFCLLYERTDNIAVPIIAHIASNAAAYALSYMNLAMPSAGMVIAVGAAVTLAGALLVYIHFTKVQVVYVDKINVK